MKKVLYGLCVVILVLLGFAIYYLDGAMPIGSGYSAKYVCSQVFLADRDPDSVFKNDVQPTMPIRLTQVGALGYDREHVRLLLDTVEVSASLP